MKSSRRIVEAARRLRREQTSAEELLWEHLKNRQLRGVKFRRQHPLGRFVADFYCHEVRLVVEVDGALHHEPDQAERDLMRTEALEERGLRVLRVSNDEVFGDIKGVLQRIGEAALAEG